MVAVFVVLVIVRHASGACELLVEAGELRNLRKA
jgi:hypothetical protein